MRHLFAALLVLATLASPLRADIDPKQMPPDTTSVLQFDYARFAQSTVGKALQAKLPVDTVSEIKKFGRDFGFDPFADLTLTVIQGAEGRPGDDPEVSILVTGLLDAATFVAELKKQGGERYTTETYQGHTIHKVAALPGEELGGRAGVKTDGDAKQVVVRFSLSMDTTFDVPYIVIHRNGMLVAATSDSRLKKIVDVLDGRSPSLDAKEAAALLPPKQDGSYFITAATGDSPAWRGMWEVEKPALADGATDDEGQLPMLGLSITRMGVTIGEADGQLFVEGRAQARNAEAAANIKAVIDGFRAMMAMGGMQKPALDTPDGRSTAAITDALSKAQITADQASLTASVRITPESALDILMNVRAEEQSQPRK